MVCLVKDTNRNHLVPSCAMPAEEGMHILTNTREVTEARREALTLLLSDHVGDCEAPCRVSCPAFMDIPLMNRLIASGNFNDALRIVQNEIALPLVLGYICPAPCEKGCKRRTVDEPVSICMLKRSAATFGIYNPPSLFGEGPGVGSIAIIGTGPAGLSAAFFLLRSGYSCTLFDQHEQPGGPMRYQIPDTILPKEALDSEIAKISRMGAIFRMGVTVTGEMFRKELLPTFNAIILATGSFKDDWPERFGLAAGEHGAYVNRFSLSTSIPGVFACGNFVREQKMAVHSGAQGKLAAQQAEHYLKTGIFPGLDDFHVEHIPKSVSTIGHLYEEEWQEYLQESNSSHRTKPVAGTLAGLSQEEAMMEARRCMHCDCRKPKTCKLRIYSEAYGIHRKRNQGQERSRVTRALQHDLVAYESEKCIRCGLCIEITRMHGEAIGLAFAGRGFDVRVVVPFNETTSGALITAAAECAAACPTGALALKNHEERTEP
jgi:NADPH-dependent glutamate synthase beta subunit-like oxidoreductase